MRLRHLAVLVGVAGFLGAGRAAMAQTTINAPIEIPLYFTMTDSGAYKLGIYVGIGDGAGPALFEFDTGGAGLYAAYSATAGVSPWWGSGVDGTTTPVHQLYDSGLYYTGTAALATVSLFSGSNSTTALVQTANTAMVGQMDSITKVNPTTQVVEQTLWTAAGSAAPGVPPIQGAFYGDFGMSPMYEGNGITNLIAQLDYGAGVTAGYRIHVDRESLTAKLQIGLTAADLNGETTLFFDMNVDANANGAVNPVSDLDYFSQQTFNADVEIHDPNTGETLRSEGVGMTLDTGASTTLHNTQNSPGDEPDKYGELTEWSDASEGQGTLKDGLHFKLSGTTVEGETAEFFAFDTNGETNHGEVSVQNDRPNNTTYYLNTGISFFYQYDVIYNLEGKQIGIEAVPEPTTVGMVAAGAALAGMSVLARRRKRFKN